MRKPEDTQSLKSAATFFTPVNRGVDVAVIGAGPGGYPAAIRGAQLGKKVVLIEKHKLGGECLNYGCIPSKALIHTANVVHEAKQAAAWGVTVGDVRVDAAKLQAWKQSVVDKLTNGIATLCKGNNVEVLMGEASFASPSSLDVRTSSGIETIGFQNAIIATGGRPSDLPAFRFDGTRIVSTKEALEFTTLPRDFLVIGGGVSGMEIACFTAKLGVRVTVVELLDQLLPGTDPDLVRVLARRVKDLGIAFHVKSQAKGWKLGRTGRTLVDIETPEGAKKLEVDAVLVAVGRKPNTEGLNAGKAGVTLDERGHVTVDRQLRTSNERIFAVGDVIGPPFLAHKATKEGLIAAEVIAGQATEVDYRAMPAAIFTDPEIATVGLTEAEAVERGHEVKVGKAPFAVIGRALTTGESLGFVKIVMDAATRLLLGAQIVGPGASDLISELTLAIELGASVEDIALTVHPHPTLPEGIMEGAEAALGQAIHVLNR